MCVCVCVSTSYCSVSTTTATLRRWSSTVSLRDIHKSTPDSSPEVRLFHQLLNESSSCVVSLCACIDGKCKWLYSSSCPVISHLKTFIHSFITCHDDLQWMKLKMP